MQLSAAGANPLPVADRLHGVIKRRGPLDLADIAAVLGTTSEAARQQVVRLAADGLLAAATERRGFTHMLTFAEAAVTAVRLRPDLWPAVLLQLACFIGRNAGYLDAGLDLREYAVGDIAGFIAESRAARFDHGRDRFIISVHLVKTLQAAARLMEALPAQALLLAAALNRFLNAPMKGRHVLRTARQMWDLVEHE